MTTLSESTYLREAVESVLNQSLNTWSLTVLENGPGSEAIASLMEPYERDSRIQHLVTGTELEIPAYFTDLISYGSAPYVTLLHDDDRWGPRFLERRVELLEANPQCGFVFSGEMIIDVAGRSLGQTRLPVPEGVHDAARFLPVLYTRNVVPIQTVVMRRSAYESVGARFADSVGYPDHELWLRLASRFDTGCLGVWDTFDRIHPTQESSQYRLETGERMLELLDSVEGTVAVSDELRRSVRGRVLLHSALDAVERGDGPAGRAYLSQAVGLDPRLLLSRSGAGRTAAVILGLGLGAAGRRAVGKLRGRRWRAHGIH